MSSHDARRLVDAGVDELNEFLQRRLPEEEDLDYKRDLSGDFAKTIAAMANSDGGTLVFGVLEDKATKTPKIWEGFSAADPRGALANQLRDLLDARVNVRTNVIPISSDRVFFVVVVDPSPNRVVLHRDRGPLVRHHDQSVSPNRADFEALLRRESPPPGKSDHDTQDQEPATVKHARDDLHDIYDRLDYLNVLRAQQGAQRALGAWPRLEKAARGLQPGTLMLIAGESMSDTSSFAINVAVHLAVEQRGRVLYVTTAETTAQVVIRALAIRAGIDEYHFADGEFEELDYARLAPAMNDLADSGLLLLDSEVGLAEVLEQMPLTDSLDLLVIDGMEPDQTFASGARSRPPSVRQRLRAYRSAAVSRRARVIVTAGKELLAADGVPSSQRSALVRQADVVVHLTADRSSEHETSLTLVDAVVLKGGKSPQEVVRLAFLPNTRRMAEVVKER
jgi:hypothetical protein